MPNEKQSIKIDPGLYEWIMNYKPSSSILSWDIETIPRVKVEPQPKDKFEDDGSFELHEE